MNYRQDIVGLRAIAILAILIFHIDSRFAGGFIGVDIFFVISGFLITGAIWRQLEKGNFSFYEFYLKRVRRLFPALFVMLIICFGFAIYFGLSSEIQQFGKTMLASLYYVSNIFFYTQVDYFAEDAQLNPLLHTWSLSVEEQFYLIFPVLLLLIYRQKSRQLVLLLSFLFISFSLSSLLLHIDSSAAFYMAPSRFWQFLAGSLIAIYGSKIVLTKSQKELLGALGIGIIVASLAYYHEGTPFPGINAIPPTLGTALIILSCDSKTILNRLLSKRIPRFFGDISYSLYLWHWPIIVFYKLLVDPVLQRNDKITIFLLSVLLGYLSWKFVEQPFRHASVKKGQNRLLRNTMIASTGLTIIAALGVFTSVLLPKDKVQFEKFIGKTVEARSGKCFLHSGAKNIDLYDESECIRVGDKTNVLLIGDSHAAHYYTAMNEYFSGSHISQVTAAGCRPIISYVGKEYCTALIRRAFEEYLNKYEFDLVVLAGRWSIDDLTGLQNTLEFLKAKNIKIMLIGPVIEYVQPLPVLLARFGREDHTVSNNKIEGARIYTNRIQINNSIARIAKVNHISYVSPIQTMCPDRKCITILSNGEPIQFDNGHLTYNGALYLLSEMFEKDWKIKY
jgi:peptidoglycan/LPS O-acetylase OafA/YrhL